MKQKFFLMLFVLSLSITTVAQETIFPTKFTAPAEFNTGKVHISVLSRSEHQFTLPIKHETMIVRLAEIEVYPEHLTEYLKFANEVDRQSVEREPDVVCLFPMQRLRIPRRFASSKSMPPRKPIRATSRPSTSRSTSRAPCTW